ncbi:MAG: hypothetical protein A2710_24355 [Burkholderiales bacterium RIFCSPHIGHO2_01_FULL_64_960]|nr:MAG: hypothetical protein A2710_24355 [Burkholderiales bacterium RIFCSPHIGHO2_01_FULL_64_960]
MIDPLKKISVEGVLYERLPEIQAKLELLSRLDDATRIHNCALPRSHSDYVPSECLLYFVRQSLRNKPSVFDPLFKILSERVLRSLPWAGDADGTQSLSKNEIRERVYDRLLEMLLLDKADYEQRLDYFEVRFDAGVANLRKDAQRAVWKAENRSTTLEMDEEADEIAIEVEEAVGTYDPFDPAVYDDFRYRSRLDAAIDALPALQKRIIEMTRLEIPVTSSVPTEPTMVKALGKSDKTIRSERIKAYARLRILLTRGERS